jgi:hypothetical protein
VKIKLGTRVKLKPMPENDVGEEEGILVHVSFGPEEIEEIELDVFDPAQMVTVLVDEEYRDGPEDDGLRECDATQVEWPPELRRLQ